jgi:hypothetical protein
MDALSRLAGLFSLRKIPGLALTLLGLVGQATYWGWRLLEPLSRLDTLWRVVETMGGSAAMIASVISSWQFSVALIALGLGYTVFIGEPTRGVQRHTWWPYVAACVFFICVATMASVAIYGAYELELRKAHAAGAAGIARDTSPSNPQTPGNQRPLVGQARGLTSDQQRLIYVEAAKLKDELASLLVTYTPTDNESLNYANQLQRILIRSGIQAQLTDQFPRGPEEEGVMIAVQSPESPPAVAYNLRTVLEIADIHTTFIKVPPRYGQTPIILFVGPQLFLPR